MLGIEGRVVMVTGAVGNLGQATAQTLRRFGARTVLVDRLADRLNSTYPDLVDSDEHLFAGDVDATNAVQMSAVVQKAVERFGRVDALINTVGTFRGGKPAYEESDATWDLLFGVNVKATLSACRAAIPLMKREGSGSIVNVASKAAMSGGAGLAAYCASKAAVVRLTESLAAELSTSGINVNCVMPGTIDTPQNRSAMPKADFSKWTPPEDIANVIAFLVSDLARRINGAAIPIE
jgi:NAD(P)-dependent dehydrogenase (short-subunit alcohol dehydrogenase family)